MTVTGATELLGVIGYPISHSFSPVMHNAALRHLGLNHIYVPMEIKPQNLEAAIKGLCALGFKGVNVTLPFKEAVIPYMNKLSTRAATVGSVNTIVIHSDGTTTGYNSDGLGFSMAMKEDLKFSCVDKKVVIMGTGGACRAISMEVALSGAGKIVIAGRNLHKAQILIDRIKQYYPSIESIATDMNFPDFQQKVQDCDLLINATSMGLRPEDPLLVNPDWLTSKTHVFDSIYNPLETPLLREARKKGCPAANGLTMLIGQGAASFNVWLDINPPIDVMRKAILDYLNLKE
jgi:shikimate dehydrogenase